MAGMIIFSENQRTGSNQLLLPLPMTFGLTSVTQTYTSIAQNLSVESRTRGVQRWSVEIVWPPLARKEAMKVYAFLVKQQGTFGTFSTVLPAPLNQTTGTQLNNIGLEGHPQVVDTRSIVSSSINVANFNKNQEAALTAGTFFSFSNHEKLYMVTEDLVTNGLGQGILNFTPPTLSKLAPGTDAANSGVYDGGTVIIHSDPEITVSLQTDEFEIPVDEHVHYSLTATLGERVSVVNL